jgi:uncharacterized protein
MRRWLPLLLLCLGACAAQPLTDTGNMVAFGSLSYRTPVKTMIDRRFLTVIHQRYDFSCGSAALATLLASHYADRQNEESVFLGMWANGDKTQIRKLGFSLLDMKRYLAARSISGNGYKISLDQIRKVGVPGLALIQTGGYKHFVVIKGMADGEILLGDPAYGLRTLKDAEFAHMWNGIFFVIDGDAGKSTFNRQNEWALIPRARITEDMQPLSLQALNLAAPRYGEI